MNLVCDSDQLNDYLLELKEVDYSHPLLQAKIAELFHSDQTEIEKIESAFQFVRDQIAHSSDIQGTRVTCKASEVLLYKEGICYAKANLLAALLRSQGIPTGFCYQRLMMGETPEEGYCIHALNAVYLLSSQKWVRLDARGNKEGVDSQFLIDEEKLAFTSQASFAEIDYPTIFAKPHPKTIRVLEKYSNALDMYQNHLPDTL